MKKAIAAVLVLMLTVSAISSCGGGTASNDTGGGLTVTDMLGRSVVLPESIKKVACIGAGALRLYTYIGDLDMLSGVEECEKGFLVSVRPYQELNKELFKSLPSIGAGGPGGSPDAEAIIASAPDVIFSLYTADVSVMDELSLKTGIPVVVLSYGKTEAFDKSITDSLTLMGRVLGKEDRAKAVTDYIAAIKSDLEKRTADIPESEKKSVYLGCHSKYGTHGIGSSTANYSLFDAVHAKNILDINGYEGYQGEIDLETLLTINPEVIILDAGGLKAFGEEYREKEKVLMSLDAFKTGEVYVQMPYNAYYTNLEIAYADAYYCGKVLYPDRFSDVEIDKKLDEISTFLLGRGCYPVLTETLSFGYKKFDAEVLSIS